MTDAEQKLWRELRKVGQHAEQSHYDEARTAYLNSCGYVVLRFSDRDVLTAIDSVKEAIWNALQQKTPPPP
ncbi:MAG TPA: DUF559 domain-containing protein [Burkholderiales bacterium]|nr:DUF559 domain-containing protein [Burkholderiales bacterium]